MLQQNAPLAGKTTMRIGGTAKILANVKTKEDVEKACVYCVEEGLPLILLGAGSNTLFQEGAIDAMVMRIKHDSTTLLDEELRGTGAMRVQVGAGKILAMLINELATKNLDLSALTGIPGTIGGAIFGNAGQGLPAVAPSGAQVGGIWLGHFIETVTFYHGGSWQTWTKDECAFRYRESAFKDMHGGLPPVIWEVTLKAPSRPQAEVTAEVERLLNKRIETQPHLKTAGSCFKSLPDGTPAWKLIEAAGLRGKRFGGIEISQKHANFLLNVENGTFADAVAAVEAVKSAVPQIAEVEMRFVKEDGSLMF